jgi:hypothetical protein
MGQMHSHEPPPPYPQPEVLLQRRSIEELVAHRNIGSATYQLLPVRLQSFYSRNPKNLDEFQPKDCNVQEQYFLTLCKKLYRIKDLQKQGLVWSMLQPDSWEQSVELDLQCFYEPQILVQGRWRLRTLTWKDLEKLDVLEQLTLSAIEKHWPNSTTVAPWHSWRERVNNSA